ncbi:MAG TPA: hypothetical protein DCL55_02550, partial [Brevundimonas sp.]|nr:hypothetical protein [Brevundimonas sp.]
MQRARRRSRPFHLLHPRPGFGPGNARASHTAPPYWGVQSLKKSGPSIRKLLGGSAALGALLFASSAFAQDAPLIQPGAPGQDSRTLEGREAARIADNRYSADDVAFMQGMILHHGQAVEMSVLAADRTNTPAILDLASRILASQADEIAFMSGWLTERGEMAPTPQPTGAMDHSAHGGMDHSAHGSHADMPGMASPEQMARLAA